MQHHRYQQLIALNEIPLDVALDAVSISRSAASLPPRKRPTNLPDIFSPFNPPIPAESATTPSSPPCISPLSREVVAALFATSRSHHSALPPRAKHKFRRHESLHLVRPAPPPRFPASEPASASPHKLRAHWQPTNDPSAPKLQPQHQSNPAAPSFRTARSRLPVKRRAQLAARAKNAGRGLADDGVAQAATNAVLGSKRARIDNDLPAIPGVDAKLVELVTNEMLESAPCVQWDDIAGLDFAKSSVKEAVIWPMLRPDIFVGLRGPPKGLLLFGPPGTGKTMIGRAIASQSKAKFFNISASSLVSKWAGEGEKTVRALFLTARALQPSVVFIDEIDSLLKARAEGEQEFSRRIKTEFLVQMDGAGTSREDRVLVVGATNRPQELDEAARRRLIKRLYIPLPDLAARVCLIGRLLEKQCNEMSEGDIKDVAQMAEGYSGSDLYALCAEAALGPVRELGDLIGSVDASSVRPVRKSDFVHATRVVRASVGAMELNGYEQWNDSYGSFAMEKATEDAAK